MRREIFMTLWKHALSFFSGVSATRLCDREHIPLAGRMVRARKRR